MPLPNNPCCPPCTSPSWWTNILNAITSISTAIDNYTNAQPKLIGIGEVHYNISGYGSLTKAGPPASVQLYTSSLNYKIIGFGVSYLGSFPTFGSSSTDDKLLISLWNYTTNSQIGNTLTLSALQTNDAHTNEGDVIGANLAKGNIIGVKIAFDDTESQTFTGKAFDAFVYVQPLELVAPEEA
jgi:hypothetical protein